MFAALAWLTETVTAKLLSLPVSLPVPEPPEAELVEPEASAKLAAGPWCNGRALRRSATRCSRPSDRG